MALRSLLLNVFLVLFGALSVVGGLAILATGVDLHYANSHEAFVVTWIPYVYIITGLFAASLPFWQQRVR